MGRLRNANVKYAPQMFWATNPMYGHGIYHWIKDYYLDEEGIPIPEKSNIERYFVLENSKPVWFDSREDAEAVYGKGADNGVRSFRAIRAHVTQNIPLLKANPGYLSNLKALPEISRRIYLDGSWLAREEEAGLYKRTWSKIVPFPNLRARRRVRAWDLASQPVSTQSPNPDFTRGTLISKDQDNTYTIEDLVSVRDRPHVVEKLILDTAERDGPSVIVTYPCDPGQSGVARANEMRRKLAEKGIQCRIVRPHKSKRTRFLAFSAIAESGYTSVVKSDWNEEFFNELEAFTGLNKRERDDIVDTCSDAILILNQDYEVPMFDLPTDLAAPSYGGMTSLLNFTQASLPVDFNASLPKI